MINPTKQDIGRRVTYFVTINFVRIAEDYGVITSFNDYYIFVCYQKRSTSKATLREDLEWGIMERN